MTPAELVFELVRIRNAHGLTQRDVAGIMCIPHARVAELERHPDGVALARILRNAEAVGAFVHVEDASFKP